jgi:hypothetical protein
MSQIAEQEMEKHKTKKLEEDFERGNDTLQRELEAHLLNRAPGSTSTNVFNAFYMDSSNLCNNII